MGCCRCPVLTMAPAVTTYAEQVRATLSRTVVELENKWLPLECTAGTTCTLALVSGWLLTVANTGDSNAVIDDGVVASEITLSHRIQVSAAAADAAVQGAAQCHLSSRRLH